MIDFMNWELNRRAEEKKSNAWNDNVEKMDSDRVTDITQLNPSTFVPSSPSISPSTSNPIDAGSVVWYEYPSFIIAMLLHPPTWSVWRSVGGLLVSFHSRIYFLIPSFFHFFVLIFLLRFYTHFFVYFSSPLFLSSFRSLSLSLSLTHTHTHTHTHTNTLLPSFLPSFLASFQSFIHSLIYFFFSIMSESKLREQLEVGRKLREKLILTV